MKKLAYLDCPTGIAGDMCLGALVHAGVPLDYLVQHLDRLPIADEYELAAEPVHRNGQQATKVQVTLRKSHSHHTAPEAGVDPHHTFDHSPSRTPTPTASDLHSDSHHTDPDHGTADHSHAHHRHLADIEQMILAANLPARATAWSLAIFRKLAAAEGSVHGIAPEQVHFHEVGATDAIVDIVGTCLGLDWLDIDALYCSALPTGGGTIWAAHGRLPVPSPAVLRLWETHQVPVYSNGIDRELVTPTGAAIAVTLAQQFGPPPPMVLKCVGLGAGSRDLAIPNILRLWVGEAPGSNQASTSHAQRSQRPQEMVSVLETQVDDLNPQAIGYLFEALFEVGALDVFTQPIGMKKSRPGILLTVICHPAQRSACETVLFRETSTLGIRHREQPRTLLERQLETVETEYGPVRVKVAWDEPNGDRQVINVQPEYEDCAQIARSQQLPWRRIHQLVLQQWWTHQSTQL